MNKSLTKRVIVGCFLLVPILSSIISTVHLVDLFLLGNPTWISYTMAIAIELGAIASFLTLSILSRINRTIVWSMFIVLFLMQVIGNVYFGFKYVSDKLAMDPAWLDNFREMMGFFFYDLDVPTAKMILSMMIGILIPLLSVFLLKSTVDYLGNDQEENIVPSQENEELVPLHIKSPETLDVVEKNVVDDQIHIQEEPSPRKRRRVDPSKL